MRGFSEMHLLEQILIIQKGVHETTEYLELYKEFCANYKWAIMEKYVNSSAVYPSKEYAADLFAPFGMFFD